MSQVSKIHIVGASGTGKSTLAKRLSKELGIPHYDLDDVRYPPKINKKQSYEERLPTVEKIANEDKWVVEGIYTNSWVHLLIREADQIIWLDLPLSTTLPRLFRRYIRDRINGTDRYGFRNFLKLIRWSIHYHFPDSMYDSSDEDKHVTKKKSNNLLSLYSDKLVIVKNIKDLDKLI